MIWLRERALRADSGRTGGIVARAMALVLGLLVLGPDRAEGLEIVVANRGTKVYHTASCRSAQRLSTERRVVFGSLAEAEAQGYVACGSCEPNSALLAENVEESQEPAALAFSRDIAPVLMGNCVGCHDATRKRGDFDMSSFEKLLAGPASGAVIVPGKPDESELIRRVMGESTPKMPPGNNRNLAEETIERLKRWILEGATIDAGSDPKAPLDKVAASPEELRRRRVEGMKPEERNLRLDEVADERWKKVLQDERPDRVDGEHFVLYGQIPVERARQALEVLDRQWATLRALLSRPGKPALDGPEKISVYVFNERNPFVEFARTVGRRELESSEMVVGDLKAEAPFLVALDPMAGREQPASAAGVRKGSRPAPSRKGQVAAGGPERGLDALLVEGLAFESVGQAGPDAPRWLAFGLGEYLAGQVEPRAPKLQRLRAEAARQYRLGWLTKSQEALGDQGMPGELRAMGFSLLEFLNATGRPQLGPFIRGMLDGTAKLDEGVQVLFGASRQDFLTAWGGFVATRYGR